MLLTLLSVGWGADRAEGQMSIPTVRVRILKSLPEVLVRGTDLSRIQEDGKVKTHKGERTIRFDCNGVDVPAGGKPVLLASVSSPTGFVTVNKKRYQGSVLLSTSSEKRKGCDVINKTTMEYYIGGLLAKEMNASWSLEALKSQAIAARTYAFYMMRSRRADRQKGFRLHYDLESSERHQVGGSLNDITLRTDRAARETGGYILEGPGSLLNPIFYHAKCGGHTFLPEQVWEYPVFGYTRVLCNGCTGRGGETRWEHRIDGKRWEKFMAWLSRKKVIGGGASLLSEEVRVATDDPTRHALRVYLGERVFSVKKSLFRQYFGRVKVPSHYFQLDWNKKSREAVLSGDGRGHGVGLCQIGALDQAEKGWSFEQILSHYFPFYQLTKIY